MLPSTRQPLGVFTAYITKAISQVQQRFSPDYISFCPLETAHMISLEPYSHRGRVIMFGFLRGSLSPSDIDYVGPVLGTTL